MARNNDFPTNQGNGDPHRALVPVTMQPSAHYDLASALLHWLIALLVLGDLAVGWFLNVWRPGEPSVVPVVQLHVSLGLTIVALAFALLICRIFCPAPPFPPHYPRWQRLLRRSVSFLLYVFSISLGLTGYLEIAFSDFSLRFWGITLPAWGWEDPDLSALFSRAHRIVVFGLLGLVAFHIVHVLVSAEQYPGLKSRMTPRWERGKSVPPATKVPVSHTVPRALARQFRVLGWLTFWTQLSLGLICVLLLVIAESSSYYAANMSTIGPALFWADATTILLLVAILASFHYTRIAGALSQQPDVSPSRRRVISSVTFAGVVAASGMACAMGGATASIALLIGKTVSQPPGIAITDPSKIIRALDVFVLLANFDLLVAHFVGFLTSLWLFNRTYLHYRPTRSTNRPAGSEG